MVKLNNLNFKHDTAFSIPVGRRSTFLLTLVLTVLGAVGCASGSNSSQGNSFAKVGETYRAPVVKTARREIDLIEVGNLNLKLASAYYAAGQYKTASESSEIAVEALPASVGALGLAALVQVELGNRTRAQNYFNRAFKLAPQDADLNHNYGVYLCRADNKKDPALAMDHFKAALAVEGYASAASTLSAGGDCLARLGRDDEALQYHTGALRFEPSNRFSLLGMADLQFRRGAIQQALDYANRYSRVAAVTPQVLWLQLRIARKLGMTADEKIYAADIRRTFPESNETRLLAEGRFE